MKQHLARHNVVLRCENGHEHIVGDTQLHLIGTPCPWCRTPLHSALWWEQDPSSGLPRLRGDE